MHKELYNVLEGKRVYIWGARIVGIGLLRHCMARNIDVQHLIDSDASIINREILGKLVLSPEDFQDTYEKEPNKKECILIIAASTKEAEIINTIKKNMIVDDLKIITYSNYQRDFYTIDISGSCNLKCLSCAHSIEDHDTPLGLMDYSNFTKVVDKIISEAPETSHVSLYSWGEPLLHPRIDEMVNYLHDRNIAVGLSSNLSHINSKIIDKIGTYSPDYLKISLSGYYDEAYNSTHQGGDIELVKSNLYRLKYVLKKSNSSTLVDINYHLYKNNNCKNLAKMQELANELGFLMSTTYALVMPLERVIDHCNQNASEQTKALSKNLLVDIDEGIDASKNIKLDGICPFRENQININADLTVPVCCLVFNREHLVSNNYLKDSLESIDENKQKEALCNTCMRLNLPQYNMGFNKDRWHEISAGKISEDNI